MGRYYDGDIHGKFAFGTQSSNAADQFGVTGSSPGHLEYYFTTENLPDIRNGLKELLNQFTSNQQQVILTYFDLHGPDDFADAPTIEVYLRKAEDCPQFTNDLWSAYYDYLLGRKILACVEEEGVCEFTAEL